MITYVYAIYGQKDFENKTLLGFTNSSEGVEEMKMRFKEKALQKKALEIIEEDCSITFFTKGFFTKHKHVYTAEKINLAHALNILFNKLDF